MASCPLETLNRIYRVVSILHILNPVVVPPLGTLLMQSSDLLHSYFQSEETKYDYTRYQFNSKLKIMKNTAPAKNVYPLNRVNFCVNFCGVGVGAGIGGSGAGCFIYNLCCSCPKEPYLSRYLDRNPLF